MRHSVADLLIDPRGEEIALGLRLLANSTKAIRLAGATVLKSFDPVVGFAYAQLASAPVPK